MFRRNPAGWFLIRVAAAMAVVLTVLVRVDQTGVAHASSVPSVVVSPTQVLPGQAVAVTGQGFQSSSLVMLSLDGNYLAWLWASGAGTFSRQVIVPIRTAPGAHTITASGAGQSAGSPVVVLGSNPPSPTATPTSASVTPTPVPTLTATPTTVATATPTTAPTATSTASPTATPTVVPTATPTATPTPTQSAQPTATASPTPSSTPVASGQPVALGVFMHTLPADMSAITGYTQEVGRPPAIVMWYWSWTSGNYPSQYVASVINSGETPMITWEPWDVSSSSPSANQPAYKLTNITRGDFDPYIHQFARDAATSGQHVYLRFAHEMNGNWYPWGTAPGTPDGSWPANPLGNTPQDYVGAWRHVHDIFAQEGATNVVWVWSPNVDSPGEASYQQLYPGDGYVDWVAMDGYNWGTTQSWGSTWTPFAQLFGSSYTLLSSLTQKPMMIAETASAEQGGSKAQWITQGFLTDAPQQFARIRAVVWFNMDKETTWQVDSSSSSLSAWQQVVASSHYQGRLP